MRERSPPSTGPERSSGGASKDSRSARRIRTSPAPHSWTSSKTGGTGTVHPTSGDTWTVTYTVAGGQPVTQSGTF